MVVREEGSSQTRHGQSPARMARVLLMQCERAACSLTHKVCAEARAVADDDGGKQQVDAVDLVG